MDQRGESLRLRIVVLPRNSDQSLRFPIGGDSFGLEKFRGLIEKTQPKSTKFKIVLALKRTEHWLCWNPGFRSFDFETVGWNP